MASAQPKPAWLTDELADVDDWIDWQDEDQSADPEQSGSELSFTQPLGSVLVRNSDLDSPHGTSESDNSGGTFIVREDMPAVPLLPKTPGKNKKPVVKDFFSPLALEKMFEPPSPPQSSVPLPSQSLRTTAAPPVRSRLSQVHVPPSEPSVAEDDDPDYSALAAQLHQNDGLKVDAAQCQFTFSAPRPSPFNPAGPVPIAQSTPGPSNLTRTPNPPPTDPRLRLFQFQYDTFTRDHLSAMVDSIAVNTPSGEGGPTNPSSEGSTPSGLSPMNERDASFSRLRSAKRLKLSPTSDLTSQEGEGAAIIIRPNSRRDYVGESRNLMEQIRKARDFSTVSTVATSRSPGAERDERDEYAEQSVKEPPIPSRPSPFLAVPYDGSSKDPTPHGTTSSKYSGYSSLGYRQQAASLMEQIRNDMKGSKRVFSSDTEVSQLRNDDATEASVLSADNTVPSPRSRNGDTQTLASLRRPSNIPLQGRRTSLALNNRLSSISRGKQRAGSSPRKASTARPSHASRPSLDRTRDLTEDLSRMSIDASRAMLAQFPAPPTSAPTAPPVRLVSASTSTAPPSPIKPSPGHLAPPTVPAYPSSSLRSGRNEDLTRFVSSSTASGTTLTVGSAESFVKHAGPKQQSAQLHIMQIKPSDVGQLPDRVGKMVFDRVMMRWVKATALATAGMTGVDPPAGAGLGPSLVALEQVDGNEPGNESEDPFRDIESLREDDTAPHTEGGSDEQDEEDWMVLEKSRIEEVLSDVDEEEAELTSFSTDGPSQDYIHEQNLPMDQGEPIEDSSFTESEAASEREQDTGDTGGTIPTATLDLQLERQAAGAGVGIVDDPTSEPAYADTPPKYLIAAPRGTSASVATPKPSNRSASGVNSVPRSVLKSASITPVSALKDPNRSKMHTPASRIGHRRSVSFSDGKRDGPIMGIGRNVPTPDGSAIGDDDSPLASGSRLGESAVLVPSARSKRIADMLENLESTDYEDDSPSKASSVSRVPDEMHPSQPRRPSTGPASASGSTLQVSRRVSSPPRGASTANATFLTECSFEVAHGRLVQVITDVQPFEPYWEELTSIDLSKRNIDSTARLKEFLPRLGYVSLNSNQLSWLSGVPGSVRTLSVASNLLTGVTSFSHLPNLECLDISYNRIDSVRQLECLKHLRELRADGNRIASLDGLEKMDRLIKLSLQGNLIREVDLHEYKWPRLEMLDLSQNRISSVRGLAAVPSLVALILENNLLGEIEPEVVMPRLRILRLSGNRLQTLNAAYFPHLRTLYADNNLLGTIVKAHHLTQLENLSVRYQTGRAGLKLSIRDVRDVKRLYLSGNPLKPGFLSEPCYNLVYLEIAACRLITLPADFARMVPNVRILNLNYNHLEDPRPLEGLTRLRKLTILHSRIKHAKQLIRMLRGMKDIEVIDFRMNPCTLGWYLPLVFKDIPGALQPSDGDRAGEVPALEPGPIGGARPEGTKQQSSSGYPHRAGISSSSDEENRLKMEPDAPLSVAPRRSSSSAAVEPPDSASTDVKRSRRERGQSYLVWRDLDAKFRRDLPDEAYGGRLAYRGLVMRACPNITMLDGIEVERKEQEKAEGLLRSISGAGKVKQAGLSGLGMEVVGS